jgi:hypothetical protein
VLGEDAAFAVAAAVHLSEAAAGPSISAEPSDAAAAATLAREEEEDESKWSPRTKNAAAAAHHFGGWQGDVEWDEWMETDETYADKVKRMASEETDANVAAGKRTWHASPKQTGAQETDATQKYLIASPVPTQESKKPSPGDACSSDPAAAFRAFEEKVHLTQDRVQGYLAQLENRVGDLEREARVNTQDIRVLQHSVMSFVWGQCDQKRTEAAGKIMVSGWERWSTDWKDHGRAGVGEVAEHRSQWLKMLA